MKPRKRAHLAVIPAVIAALGLLGGCGTKASTEESTMLRQQVEQSAQRADQAAARAEQAADRADQAAERAAQMADKSEKIFNKKMKK